MKHTNCRKLRRSHVLRAKSKIFSFLLLFSVGVIGSGCDSTVDSESEVPFQSEVNEPSIRGQIKTYDDLLADIAREVPGFAGFYIDEETNEPVVYMVNKGNRPESMMADIKPRLAKLYGEKDMESIEALGAFRQKEARFDYIQLNTWKNTLTPVMGYDGVSYLDIDETKNRIEIGVVSDVSADRIKTIARENNIPAVGITVKRVEPAVSLATLRDVVRPVAGGLQINKNNTTSNVGACTHGYNGMQDGHKVFVTNSHCTQVEGGFDAGSFFQPGSNNWIAFEWKDVPYSSGTVGCPSGKLCRLSDTALLRYTTSQQSNPVDVTLYSIKRPNNRVSGQIGSLTITSPNMVILDEHSGYAAPGKQLDKIGRTTGRTYGSVNQSCTTYNKEYSNFTLVCQFRAGVFTGQGDSGSPVFDEYGTSKSGAIYGTLWGGNSFAGQSSEGALLFHNMIYSPLTLIEAELGNIQSDLPY